MTRDFRHRGRPTGENATRKPTEGDQFHPRHPERNRTARPTCAFAPGFAGAERPVAQGKEKVRSVIVRVVGGKGYRTTVHPRTPEEKVVRVTEESPAFRYPAARERVRDGADKIGCDALDQFIRDAGRRPGKELRVSRQAPLPEPIADRLAARDAVVRRAVRLIDDRPVCVETSYYPADLAAGTELESARDIPRGTISVLAEHGHPQVGYRDEVAAHVLDAPEAHDLEAAAGTPALNVVRTVWSRDRVLRVTTTVTPMGGDLVLCYDIGAPAPVGDRPG
nr:UTRA domain-containing protein [Nocardiopsis mwathae]